MNAKTQELLKDMDEAGKRYRELCPEWATALRPGEDRGHNPEQEQAFLDFFQASQAFSIARAAELASGEA
ncbi:MAG TPA: hypothetical protein VHD81_04425 [Mycobacteriales bacterium]|nr:hypothetical protein [Mycobacteriales bacterium]